MPDLKRAVLVGTAAALVLMATPLAAQEQQKPNILVIWGDDIGTWNISHNNRGMMGYRTPNIDRIAAEGLSFTDYYAQQSCTAGRAAFIGGNVPVRTGMTKVGLPGAAQGWQATDVTMASVLKSQGYATGQFGKNHQGDRDEHLPTMHGFDEFFGNLYHLNAEEEPENRDYPGDMVLANGKTFREQFGPRGVIHSWANPDGTQRIEDTGPLTRKRMETVDDETLTEAKRFITEAVEADEPFFVWWNGTRMHFRTHVREEHTGIAGPSGDEYHDGMVEHDMQVGELLALVANSGSPTTPSSCTRPTTARTSTAGPTPAPRRSAARRLELGRRLPRARFRALAGAVPRRRDAERHRRARGLAADLRRHRRQPRHQAAAPRWG